jgi:hypothetical protein
MKIFKKISTIKFTFKIPTKKKVLIYDLYSEKILSKILKEDYNIISTRYEKISLPVFTYSLIINFKDTLKFKNIYFNYLKTFINFAKPLSVITFVDNDKKFFRFKKYFKNIKFIAIQNGYRFYKNDLFESIQNSNYIFECDEYYCYGENIKNYLKDKIQANIIAIGSLKNNYCTISKDIIKKNLCFISSFGISNHKYEKLLLNIIYEFCQKKKINLEILARRKNEEEKDFFHNILRNKKFIFHEQKNAICSSYSVIDKAEICFSLNASLGYESLARGNKTLFFNLNDRNLSCDSFTKFGYPEKFEDEGFFWTNKLDTEKTIDKINQIYNLSEQEWKDKTYEVTKKVMVFDSNNQIIQNKLKQLML